MRETNLFITALLTFASVFSWSQKDLWSIENYEHQIIKIVYTPEGYTRNENLSDAVIMASVEKSKTSVTLKEDTLSMLLKKNLFKSIYPIQETTGHYGFSIRLGRDEKIYGGGSRALPINRRGFAFDLDNKPWYGYSEGADNLNYSVPFFISSEGYGILFDNPSRGHVDIGKMSAHEWRITFSSGELNFFIIPGQNVSEILKKYHLLTGFQGLPPRWVLGNFMSRFGYTSEQQVNEIAQKMKDSQIPFDAIIFDLFWFGDSIKGTMGNLAWVNKEKWPDPQKMISGFKKDNIKTVLITEPFVLKSSLNYEESQHLHSVDKDGKPYILQEFYFGEGGLIDIFRKDAREWFWEKHDAQNKIGVDGWWGDLGEPEKHPEDMYHNLKDWGYKRLFSSDEVHNIYGHYWTKMLFDNYTKKYPNIRLFSLNRSGFAGSQRYNIFPWSGDVHRSWSGLKAQLPIMLGMSLSGIPYMHSDAGGFAMGDGDYELYHRWLQMAVFSPILRPHGTALGDVDKTAFSFPSEPALLPEPYKTWAKDAILLRYQLLPYNYTLAYNHTVEGRPLAVPLFYDYPNDERVQTIDKNYLWGHNILVAPILEKNQNEMNVVLPKGKWYHVDLFHKIAKDIYTTHAQIKLENQSIPIFIKEGSFIPMCPQRGMTSEDFTTDSLWVQYYQSKHPSTYTLFDDDGKDKNSIAKNEYELIELSAKPRKKSVSIKIDPNGNTYPTQPLNRHITLQIIGDKKYSKALIKSGSLKYRVSIKEDQTLRIRLGREKVEIRIQE